MLTLRRGDAGYDAARRNTMANRRCPSREPELIARPETDEDVVSAVRLAVEHDLRISVCSGGHSWAGSHLRDGGLLIDMGAMTAFAIDATASTAEVQPGLRSSDLAIALSEQGLFFPTGHCIGPSLGGFLLQGGFGWNSRRVGPACMSVTAIDVVTAEGEMVRADAEHHPDLYWAARGSGPGFFGVVTRFELSLHARPAAQMSSAHLYAREDLDELMRWVHHAGPDVPDSIELMVFFRRDLPGHAGIGLQLLAPALCDSEEQARADLAFVADCPLRPRAVTVEEFVATDVRELVAHSADFYPSGHRYAVDNMWTHADVDALLPGYRRIADTLPASPSHMMWMNWRPHGVQRPDMAYSLEDDVYLGLYGVWPDAADDAQFENWSTDRMREMEGLASGIQLADENLARRPAPFVADENLQRIDAVRSVYDPSGRFHSWMGRPAQG